MASDLGKSKDFNIQDDKFSCVSFLPVLEKLVENSYANNNKIYAYLEKSAPFAEIYRMQFWNSSLSGLITFNEYLKLWLPRIPDKIKFVFLEHLKEEEDGQHSRLYKEMMAKLKNKINTSVDVIVDNKRLVTLNYPYSQSCLNEKNVGFFLGSFYATEAMSAKRCQQLFNGFLRVGMHESDLEYLKLHLEADCHHADEIGTRMILPYVEDSSEKAFHVLNGVEDRLTRSGSHLLWYESVYMKSQDIL